MASRLFPISIGVVFACSAFAQQAEVSGSVKDTSGAAIPKARITLRNEATNVQTGTASNDDGLYRFGAVMAGKYKMTVEATGFETKVMEDITVDIGAKVVQAVEMPIGRSGTSIVVSANQLHINETDASVSTVIHRDFVQNIPLNGRSFQSLLTAVPGVNVVPSVAVGASGAGAAGEMSVNGQRTEQNYFMVDGVSANTGAPAGSAIGFGAGLSGGAPSATVLGTTQAMVSIDALEEFRATTSSYSAEYGRTPGGQFSFETRSGTNTYHGLLFDYLRNGKTDANNWFNNQAGIPLTPVHQNDFGGTFGGPLQIPNLYNGKDKTFFFFSYEGLRLSNPVAASLGAVPSLELRQNAPAALKPLLNAFPLPTQPDNGDGTSYYAAAYTSPGSLDTSAIRVDHNFNESFKIFGRYSDSGSNTTSRDPGNLAERPSYNGRVRYVTLGATNILSPRWSNDLRINFTSNNQTFQQTLDSFGGATPFALTDLPGLNDARSQFSFYLLYGLYPYFSIGQQQTRQHQFNITDSMSITHGRHNLKLGFDYRRIHTNQPLPPIFEQGWFFDEDSVLANQLGGSNLSQYPVPMNPVYTNISFFGQDEWRVSNRLSLSLGLRWDINPAPSDTKGNLPYGLTSVDPATVMAAPKGSQLWKTTYGNIAPRMGLAYRLRQDVGWETVIRAGAGLFYDATNVTASNGYYGIGFAGGVQPSGVPFPFTASQVASLPAPNADAPYVGGLFGADPHLKLPYSWQWNVALEQALGSKQTLTLNYVGSAGRRLLANKEYAPNLIGNPNFSDTSWVRITSNLSESNYDAFQARYQRRLTRGLQALFSYTWSHSLDDVSSNSLVTEQLYGNSSFDVRHNFQATLTSELPGRFQQKALQTILGQWGLDLRFTARSGLPIDVVSGDSVDPATGRSVTYHPDRIAGAPLYVSDPNSPGGRRINFDAFQIATDADGNLIEGNGGRNTANGFSAVQLDLALRKDFNLAEKMKLQFRAEGFNLLNHANFGSIFNGLNAGPGLFGQASTTLNTQLGGLSPLYQTGGPRSFQFSLRLSF